MPSQPPTPPTPPTDPWTHIEPDDHDKAPPPKKKRRWWWKILLVIVVLLIALVALLPAIVSSGPVDEHVADLVFAADRVGQLHRHAQPRQREDRAALLIVDFHAVHVDAAQPAD